MDSRSETNFKYNSLIEHCKPTYKIIKSQTEMCIEKKRWGREREGERDMTERNRREMGPMSWGYN